MSKTISDLVHVGTKRHSGRYPWGSGVNPQRTKHLLSTIKDLKESGMSERDIAKAMGMSTTELRQQKSIAKAAKKQADVAMVVRLKDKGVSTSAIARRLGIPEPTVRSMLKPSALAKADSLETVSNVLKANVEQHKYIDIGKGSESFVGTSDTTLKTVVRQLVNEGYAVHNIQVLQQGTGNKTTIKVLAPPGTTYVDIVKNQADIKLVNFKPVKTNAGLLGLEPIQNIDLDRLSVRYDEDGGTDMDGVIELRRGVKDLSLGNANYAQVRIGIGGTHYVKGMAIYADDLPKGTDIRFNTNKSSSEGKTGVLKKQSSDTDNPFGSSVIQTRYDDNGVSKVSALNIVGTTKSAHVEGRWSQWSRNLSSQFLSKQSPALIRSQLDIASKNRESELDDILKLTNPVVRKHLLQEYADGCDSSARKLKAAALPGQKTAVLLPLKTMSEKEIYAPNFNNGDRVVLVRHPHGGIFEIPSLVVNNKNRAARRLFKNAKDAVGINPKVAERLSGADFDGDSVLVIPDRNGRIRTSKALPGLKNFDPRRLYPKYDGMPLMSDVTKQREMGKISNLITDMTLKGASETEIAAAVRHSMVVIDAEKHELNYRQSAIDNGIRALKVRYQDGGGASTLISRANSKKRVDERSMHYTIDDSGDIKYKKTGKTYVDGKGKTVKRQTTVRTMSEYKDAHDLNSGTVAEHHYAEYANQMKGLARRARLALKSTRKSTYSRTANKTYRKQVDELESALNIANRNKPKERQAQLFANKVVEAKVHAIRTKYGRKPKADELKKIRSQALTEARIRYKASKPLIEITPKHWEAIQMGAITNNRLTDILNNTDVDIVRAYATPKRTQNTLSTAKRTRAKSMLDAGYSNKEVASAIGVTVELLNDTI